MSADTVTFEFEIPGLARPVSCEAELEGSSVGFSGGWFLVSAKVPVPPGGNQWDDPIAQEWDRVTFRHLFGPEMLRAVEEHASDVAQDRRYEDQDRREEIA